MFSTFKMKFPRPKGYLPRGYSNCVARIAVSKDCQRIVVVGTSFYWKLCSGVQGNVQNQKIVTIVINC